MGHMQTLVDPSKPIGSLIEWKRLNPENRFLFNVDILGQCNLRCPSCPIGNSTNIKNPTGYMSPDLLDKILKKATAECEVTAFELYNWTEPLLHPKLPELIRIVRSYGVRCGLSANLNVIKNMEGILGANPTYLTISVSGFTQDGYGMTHARGKIDLVKQNMAEVARAKDRTGATMEVRVAFHRYLGNHQDELEMKEYTELLRFRFDPEWAYLMPLEKVLAYTAPDSIDVELTDQDRDLIDRLADVKITDAGVEVSFHRRAHLPIILASGLKNEPSP